MYFVKLNIISRNEKKQTKKAKDMAIRPLTYSSDVNQQIASITRMVKDYPEGYVLTEIIRNSLQVQSTTEILVFPVNIEIDGGIYEKLCVVNNGEGLTKSELATMSKIHSSINKPITGDEASHGFGVKGAAASQSPFGTYFISNTQKAPSPYGFKLVVEEDGTTGLEEVLDASGNLDDVWDATDFILDLSELNTTIADKFNIDREFTAVILLGKNKDDNTCKLLGENWIGDDLHNRFYQIRSGCKIYVDNQIAVKQNKKKKQVILDGYSEFVPISKMPYQYQETIKLTGQFDGVEVFFGINEETEKPFGLSANRRGRYTVVYQNEMFETELFGQSKVGYLWGQFCARFNLHANAAKFITIIVNLPNGMVRMSEERDLLQYGSNPLSATSFNDALVSEIEKNIPKYVIDFNKTKEPQKHDHERSLEKSLSKFLNDMISHRDELKTYIKTPTGKPRLLSESETNKAQGHSKKREQSNDRPVRAKRDTPRDLDENGKNSLSRQVPQSDLFDIQCISDIEELINSGLDKHLAMFIGNKLRVNLRHSVFKEFATIILQEMKYSPSEFSKEDWETLLTNTQNDICEKPLIQKHIIPLIVGYKSRMLSENSSLRDTMERFVDPHMMTAIAKNAIHGMRDTPISIPARQNISTIAANAKKRYSQRPKNVIRLETTKAEPVLGVSEDQEIFKIK